MTLSQPAAIATLPVAAPTNYPSIARYKADGFRERVILSDIVTRVGSVTTTISFDTGVSVGGVSAFGGSISAVGRFAETVHLNDVSVHLLPPKFIEFVKNSSGAGQYLLEMSAAQGGGDIKSGGLGSAITEIPIASVPPSGKIDLRDIEFRFSDAFWVGEPSDTYMSNIEFEDRLGLPLSMDRSMPVLPEASRRIQRQSGFLELNNIDGELDSLVGHYSVSGRAVRVSYGQKNGRYSDFGIVGELTAVRFEHNKENIKLVLRDKGSPLDHPLQQSFYSGEGGLEGTSTLKSTSKPLVFGEVYNISLTSLVPTQLVYQIHDGRMEAVISLRDNGLDLSLDINVGRAGDVETYTALKAAEIRAGHYITCLALGLVRLGSSPSGLLTADVKGDKTGGVYVDLLSSLILRIFERQSLVRQEQLNLSSWRALENEKCGFWAPHGRDTTAAAAIDFLLSSQGASWGAARTGVLKAYTIKNPETQDVNLFLNEEDIIGMNLTRTIIPRWRQSVGYRRHWVVQDGSVLAGAVSPENRSKYSTDYLVASETDINIRTRHLDAVEPPVLGTALVESQAAQSLAHRLLELHGADRAEYEITLKRIGWLIDLGQIIAVRYGRFGFENGKNVLVRRIRENARREEIILTVWC